MMRLKFICALVLFLPVVCLAQVTDNFSDGDFNTQPVWSGDATRFTIVSGKLKLQAPATADASYLSTPSSAIHEAVWEFTVQLDFNPSSTNYAKIYVVSDQQVLTGSLNGYFIKAGGTTDEVSLYRQNGLTEIKIIDGADGRLNLTSSRTRVRLFRDAKSGWKLFTDVGMTEQFSLEGSVTDDTFAKSEFFGVACVYTSTRSDKFWFDDIVVKGGLVPDTTPPLVQKITVEDEHRVVVVFNEKLDSSVSKAARNFVLNKVGIADRAMMEEDLIIRIYFEKPLSNGVSYTLSIEGVQDIAGNRIAPIDLPVMYFNETPVQWKDVIINEVMADPSPGIGLPEVEYVEIFNRSNSPFSTENWTISDGSTKGHLAKKIVLPGDFAVLINTTARTAYPLSDRIIPVNGFPSLNNDTDLLMLRDGSGRLIDSISYSSDWYHDQDKSVGGWSIELIDPNNPCGDEENWSASEDPRGGTPGEKNSMFASKPDLTGPGIISVLPRDDQQIEILFDEKLDPDISSEHYQIEPTTSIKDVNIDPSRRVVTLRLEDKLKTKQLYSIQIRSVRDCNGNESEEFSKVFGMAEEPDSSDIVINEILFNPRTDGVDFLEIINVSDKIISLGDLRLANLSEQKTPVHIVSTGVNALLFPGEYELLTSDPETVYRQYPSGKRNRMLRSSLPSMPDDEGSIAVLNAHGEILDAVSYLSKWHSQLLKDIEGVSLERIEISSDSSDPNNWISASSVSGYATPGAENSRRRSAAEEFSDDVWLDPPVFVAGENFTQINYRFTSGDWMAQVKIFDASGHLLKELANNETLATRGFFRWDGTVETAQMARSGYYLLWFQAFNATGEVRTFRKRVIIAK